ncbi:MAG: class I SAM-dependent methyltransferase [Candidatus Levybacteria bacterium]|nr:class I SAM-dependent methyltransferase [Candidatus Levybacteria bacterium]
MFNLPGKFFLKRCNACSLAFLDPQPSQLKIKKYYPSKAYYAYNKSNKKGFFEKLRDYLVSQYYSPNFLSRTFIICIKNVPAMPSYVKKGKILDVGCGTGDTLVLLKKLGWDTYGIDMDNSALAIGRKRGLENLKLGTYKDLDTYPDNYFDAIRLYHVIEHLDDPALCLRLIRKKLKRKGELIMGTPNMESMISKLFKSYWYNLDSPRHFFLFSPATLGKLVEKEGFRIKKIEFCSAGGIAGSLQYFMGDMLNKKIDLIHKLVIVLLFYPVEWILDKLYVGDIFALKADSK